MFGFDTIEKKNYLLLGVYKCNVIYTGVYSYDKDTNKESIVSINSGETFYDLKSFVFSILGLNSTLEWYECYYYDEYQSNWISLSTLLNNTS